MSDYRSGASDVPFLRVSTVPREFIVVGRVQRVWMHYGYACSGGRLCSGEDCAACRDGHVAEQRAIWRLEEGDGTNYLLESRPRLSRLVGEIEALQASRRTAVLQLWRVSEHRNAAIEGRFLREIAYPELYDLSRLVDRLYQPAMRIQNPPRLLTGPGSDSVNADSGLHAEACEVKGSRTESVDGCVSDAQRRYQELVARKGEKRREW